MVDSRDKGARAETLVKETLRNYTKLNWERVPGSGALDEKHQLKGDLYIPGQNNLYCVEVKHYKDCHINHSLITGKNPQLIEWWKQTIRQAEQVNKRPLLIFKHDRSKIFAAYLDTPSDEYPYIIVNKDGYEFVIALLEDYLHNEKPQFIV
jgi:hypothetical protein